MGEGREESHGGKRRAAAKKWACFVAPPLLGESFLHHILLRKTNWKKRCESQRQAERIHIGLFVCGAVQRIPPTSQLCHSLLTDAKQEINVACCVCVCCLQTQLGSKAFLLGGVCERVCECVCVCVFAWGEVCYLPTGQKWSEAKQCQVRKAVALSFPLCCCFLSLNQCVPAFIPSSQSVSLQPYPKQEAVTWRRYNQSQCRSLHTSPCQRPNSRLTEDNNV